MVAFFIYSCMKYLKNFNESVSKFTELTKDQVKAIIDYASSNVSHTDYDGKKYMASRLVRIMQINKFKSIYEPKAHALIHKKPFIRYEKEENGWYGFILTYFHKSFIETFVSIKKFPGTDGNKELYVWSRLNGTYVVFTRHFFERYYQRTIDENARIFTDEKIDIAIKNFIKVVLVQMTTKALGGINVKDYRVMMPFDNGFGLGYEVNGSELLMTFVDNKSAKSSQKKEIDDFMEGAISDLEIEFMQYDLKPYKKKY